MSQTQSATSPPPGLLKRCYLGFRERWFDHEEIQAQLRRWAEAFPDLVRLVSLGTTPEGRDLSLLIVGHEPDRARPSVWVDGNMHASELCGSAVALAIAETVLAVLLGEPVSGIEDPVRSRLEGPRYFIMPRISPDGAEEVLKRGRYVRSVPRDARTGKNRPRWLGADLDGDRRALVMRKKDPGGEFVEHPEHPGLMVLRGPDDHGPAYKLWPEGRIEDFDGFTVPDPGYLCDTATDLNRNFPYDWRPEPEQLGAGAWAGSTPEATAIIRFADAHPEIFLWLNLHTFGGCFIRPPGDGPDHKMNAADLSLFRWIGADAQRITGYPMVSGFAEFTYEPEKPLRGDLVEYAHRQRGCIAYVCELWDLFAQLGRSKPARFVDHYFELGRDGALALARWDREHNGGRVFQPWIPFTHPQVGDVEIGGLDLRFGVTNPPLDRLPRICADQTLSLLRVASLAPSLTLTVSRQTLSPDVSLVDVMVRNEGALGTRILREADKIPWNDGVSLHVEALGDVRVEGPVRKKLGHLDGWFHGPGSGTDSVFYTRSPGNHHERRERFMLTGPGRVRVTVEGSRMGALSWEG